VTVRIGINGFGRMGRLALRAAWDQASAAAPDIAFVHINEIARDAAGSAHLLAFDSVQGRFGHDCSGDGDALVIGGKRIGYSSDKAITKIFPALQGKLNSHAVRVPLQSLRLPAVPASTVNEAAARA
jgi:glyceraldehyde 3-phosphate dehydrogenase